MACWLKVQGEAEDVTSGLAGSFTDDPVPLSREELQEMANALVFVEDDPVVNDTAIDEQCGLDGEGTGTGFGEDAEWGGGSDDECAECDIVDEGDEEMDYEWSGTVSLFNVEELIEQLRKCNSALRMPSAATIHLDRFAYAIRKHHMATTKRATTITSHFKSN